MVIKPVCKSFFLYILLYVYTLYSYFMNLFQNILNANISSYTVFSLMYKYNYIDL